MKLLPSEHLTYKTTLAATAVLSRIKDITESPKSLTMKDVFSTKNRKYFIGEVRDDSFKVTRIIANRNAFRPDIHGVVSQDGNETSINVKMNIDPTVIAFLGVIASMALAAFLLFLFVGLGDGDLSLFNFIPIGILCFIYGIVMLGFTTESSAAKSYLEKLLEATRTEDSIKILS